MWESSKKMPTYHCWMRWMWTCRKLVGSRKAILYQIDHTCHHRNCYRYVRVFEFGALFLSLLLSTCPVGQLFKKFQASIKSHTISGQPSWTKCAMLQINREMEEIRKRILHYVLRYHKKQMLLFTTLMLPPSYVALHPFARTCAEARQSYFSPRPLPLSLRFR